MSDTFELLTSVGPKPFLNINCNDINCNDLVAASITDLSAQSSIFNANQSAGMFSTLAQGAAVTNACDAASISNANLNLGTNVFTAPVAGDYSFSLQFDATNLANPQDVRVTGAFSVNAVVGTNRIIYYPAAVALLTNSFAMNDIFRLAVGDTVGYRIRNDGLVANNVRITQAQFIGNLLV